MLHSAVRRHITTTMAVPAHMTNFVKAMQHVYNFPTSPTSTPWTPPPMKEGHRGRYLWTDAFGVLNLITLSQETDQATHYLDLARALVTAVHNTLGRTRDDPSARLPGATDANPLGGGLRIGKDDDVGSDADGQYHHYLTLWMFALNRLAIATNDNTYNDQAVALARAVHPAFVHRRDQPRPLMFWKVSTDLSRPLVRSEGNLDPIDGYVIFSLLQQQQQSTTDANILTEEISTYKKMLDTKVPYFSSTDTLDIGMALWTAHWFTGIETWADELGTAARRDLLALALRHGWIEERHRQSLWRRLAFREFGTCLGIRVARCGGDFDYLADKLVREWEEFGRVPVPREGSGPERLEPIDLVMYAAALCPGAFRRDYLRGERH